jgi:hypothetical protein
LAVEHRYRKPNRRQIIPRIIGWGVNKTTVFQF